ncbi:MFS transporter [Chloroflexota bacterium]
MADIEVAAHRYRWVIIGVLWTAYIVIFMHRLSIGPLAPFIKEEMGLSSAQVGSLMSAVSFGYLLSMIPAGWAVDRIGVRKVLIMGELIGGISMLGFFFVPSYNAGLAVMGISGFGCGCIFPSTTKGVMEWFPANERATIMGLKQTGVNVGGVVSAAVLPLVAIALNWRYGFLFLAILAILIGILTFALYRDPSRQPVSDSGDGIDRPADKKAAGQSLRHLLRSRDLWLLAWASFFLGIIEFAVMAHLVLYLTEELLYPVVTAGVILAVTQAGGILGKPGSGILSDRLFGGGRKKVFLLWAILTGIICLMVALWGGSLSWALYPVLFILGLTAIGWGGISLTLIGELSGTELAGRAVSIVGEFIMIGFIIGPVLFGYFVDITGSYQPSWLFCAACGAVSAVSLLFVRAK